MGKVDEDNGDNGMDIFFVYVCFAAATMNPSGLEWTAVRDEEKEETRASAPGETPMMISTRTRRVKYRQSVEHEALVHAWRWARYADAGPSPLRLGNEYLG